MTNIYLLQLVGLILLVAGLLALMASTHLFGTRFSTAHKRMSSDEWNRRRSAHRWPLNLESFISLLCLAAGAWLLIWTHFSLCGFLAYWMPSAPGAVRLLLSCR